MLSYAEFCDKFNIRLDAQQAQAVQCTDRAVLLLAVPGSGKTTTLITRAAYLVYCMGIAPENILTMTYTKAETLLRHQLMLRVRFLLIKHLNCGTLLNTILMLL